MKLSHMMVLMLLSALPAVADPVRVPGTGVSLQPPAGFELAGDYPGFQSAEQQASIMVTQMPAPVAEIRKAMNKETLATRGITLLSSKEETVGGREALLLHVAQSAAGTDYLKWMLVTGDPKETVMIVGTFLKSAGEEVGAAIRTALLSASLAAAAPSDPFEGLRFRIMPTQGLKIAGRVSNMLLLNESGSPGTLEPGEPVYVIGSSFRPGGSGDLRVFSEARAKQTEQIRDLEHLSGREITIGGLTAYELLADAKDVKSGRAIRLYQVIAPDGDGYFIAQGLVGTDRAAGMLPEFRRVTESFRKVD
ncbi:MAG TPA: hypothetical protein VNM67_26685 [Thermoanaerobaculia bacterium]|nr:hypothetical protein [Thermoanaerobaculia bacterium]